MTTVYDILRRPIVTEKSNFQSGKLGQYVFEVAHGATKAQIKEAVETLFDVNVERVNVLTAFPEIGLEKARTILAHYGTLKAALDAHNEWEEVEGVGPKTREGVTRVLTE